MNKYWAAIAQLEAAIFLWFFDNAPVAVHTLAVAAGECFNGLMKDHVKSESYLQRFLQEQSKEFRDSFREAQNFFKHGSHSTKTISLLPFFTDVILADAVISRASLPGVSKRPMLVAFELRFFLENPHDAIVQGHSPFLKSLGIKQGGKIGRRKFYERYYHKIEAAFPLSADNPKHYRIF